MGLGAYLYKEILNRGGDLKTYAPLYLAESTFHSWRYLRHTARRLEHLASLQLQLSNQSVLELGAGIGDHSHFFLDRNCKLTITESREENLAYLRLRYPNNDIRHLNLESADTLAGEKYDIIYAYGILYHISDPESALEFFERHCTNMLLLETCVSFGYNNDINKTPEDQQDLSQSIIGEGCRPTRTWLWSQLKKYFQYVYLPKTQPNHEEFPIDWSAPEKHSGLARSIFIASRTPIENDQLTTHLLINQSRQL